MQTAEILLMDRLDEGCKGFIQMLEAARGVTYALETALAERMRQNGLQVNGIQALLIWAHTGAGINLTTLKRLGYPKSNINYNIQTLVEKGFFTSMQNPQDLRMRTVQRTDRGEQVRHLVDKYFHELYSWCGKPDATEASVLFRNIIRAVRT